MAMLTLKTLNKAVGKKFPHVQVVKGEGYFYLYSDDKETGRKIGEMYQSGIYVNSLNQMPLERWISEIEMLITKDRNQSFAPEEVTGDRDRSLPHTEIIKNRK